MYIEAFQTILDMEPLKIGPCLRRLSSKMPVFTVRTPTYPGLYCRIFCLVPVKHFFHSSAFVTFISYVFLVMCPNIFNFGQHKDQIYDSLQAFLSLRYLH